MTISTRLRGPELRHQAREACLDRAEADGELLAAAFVRPDLLVATCEEGGRNPASIGRTADLVVDPLDVAGARDRSIAVLERLRGLGFDEVRCYPLSDPSADGRRSALDALASLADALR